MELDDREELVGPSRFSQKNARPCMIFGSLSFLAGLICLIVGIVLISSTKTPQVNSGGTPSYSRAQILNEKCSWSDEAQRIKLPQILKKVQDAYAENNPDNTPWQSGIGDVERPQHVKENFYPYNSDPVALKKKSDHSLALFKEIKNIKVDQSKLKPRESKALAQAQHLVQTNFGVPYDENYYAGDWMMGPNSFCWQPMCNIMYGINAYFYYVKPKSEDDVRKVIKSIMDHKTVIDQYRENIKMGVRVGMVRSVEACQAGLDSFKQRILKLVLADNATAVLKEWYTAKALAPNYLKNLSDDIKKNWEKSQGESVDDSIKNALVTGFGQPLLDLYKYLRDEHKMYCVPNEVSSGLGGLPLDFVYYNGKPQKNNKTTKKLPTGEVLDGKKTYEMILAYFSTTDITPDMVYEEGQKQLDITYKQLKEFAKRYTNISDENKAIGEFKKVIANRSLTFFNEDPFPEIESNATAYQRCKTSHTAKKYCPIRWVAVQKWAKHSNQIIAKLQPIVSKLFYYTGAKRTAPACPIYVGYQFNPRVGYPYYSRSDSKCSRPAKLFLPFFLNDMGPIYQQVSSIAHETIPGHHIQIQGGVENFIDPCGGIPVWLNTQSYYTVFTEGWALYSENPIMSNDTYVYNDVSLQKFGMLKWMIWRAVRLIVDTGLHYKKLSRADALKMFQDYAWDTTEFAIKEVTRYQSSPGQATTYMLGRLELVKMRQKAESELGKKFNIKDFHLQVLSQGVSPFSYIQNHIDNWIKCVKSQGKGNPMCEFILKPFVTQLPPEDES